MLKPSAGQRFQPSGRYPNFRIFLPFESFLSSSSLKLRAKRPGLACVTTYPVDSMN